MATCFSCEKYIRQGIVCDPCKKIRNPGICKECKKHTTVDVSDLCGSCRSGIRKYRIAEERVEGPSWGKTWNRENFTQKQLRSILNGK